MTDELKRAVALVESARVALRWSEERRRFAVARACEELLEELRAKHVIRGFGFGNVQWPEEVK